MQMNSLKRNWTRWLALVSALSCTISIAQAADDAKKAEKPAEQMIEKQAGVERGRLSIKGRASFLMRGSFTGLGSFPAQTAAGATTATAGDRFYDDGFNRVDASAIADGKTWFWGYWNASQVGGGVGTETISMNSSTAQSDAAVNDVDSDIAPGVELNYHYKIKETSKGHWGFLGGLGYSFVNVDDTTVALGTEVKRTDTFAAAGSGPPAAPFTGTSVGPHPRIDNAPTSSATATIVGGSAVGGLREIDANILDFRLGPYADFEIGKGVTLSLSAGGLGAFIDSEFSVNETTTITGIGPVLQPGVSATQTTTASSSESGFVFGGFAGLELGVQISPRTSIFAGAEYRYLQDFDQTLGARRATLHLDRALNANLGLSFSF
jgi:hypothetical protein